MMRLLVVWAILVTLPSSVSATCPDFAAAVNYGAGTNPSFVAVGDFNGDGTKDLAVANYGTSNISILLGNGDGTFAAAVNYTVGRSLSIAVGDFDGDTDSDLAVANQGSAFGQYNVAVLLGNGNGTFASPVYYTTDSSTSPSVALGDFNGDTKIDLAVANGGGNVSILIGNGNGTFATAINYSAGLVPYSVAVADFNADTKSDLAVANGSGNDVSILLGNGNGTFAAPANYSVGSSAVSVAVSDFNADSKLDLAVANSGSNTVSILLGNGDGTFAAATNQGVGTSPRSVIAGDFDGNGMSDLAVANNVSNNVSVRLGFGDGTFAAPVNFPASTGPYSVAASDFNGDNKSDLAVANNTANNVSILINICVSEPDLAIAKMHSGNFTQGQTGATYTITVSNVGTVASNGTVTVTESLPSAFIATGIGGTGWNCTLAILTCSRSDALAASASYPAITLTVNVRSNATSGTNTAAVSGGGQVNMANDTASDPTTVNASGLIGATSLAASAASTTQIGVSWDAVTTATRYDVHRSSNNNPFAVAGSAMTTNFTDTGLMENTAYVYYVRAVDASSNVGPPSNADVATTIVFTDDPLVAGSTLVKAIHLVELRTAVNAVRAAAGLPEATFTDSSPAGIAIKAVHVNELRSNLDPARAALGLPALAYSDPSLTKGITVVIAAHVKELRDGVK